jgi:N-acetyl sugar amidotransferase
MRYCTRCVLPDSRPGLELGADGVCSACRAHAAKATEIDWPARERRFTELVEQTTAKGRPWDCVIPVSGGKDSTWQVVTCLEAGLHPLCVTWRTPGRTPLGQRNLDNLISLGVDHIDFTINPEVEKKLLLRSLERFGTTAIPMHLALFHIPLTVAARYEIPLVVWGEDSSTEYVGTDVDPEAFTLTGEWIARYGAVHGTTAADWVAGDLSERDLAPYFGPSDEELREKGVEAVFLGWFFEWDPLRTAEVAMRHGFAGSETGPRTGTYTFADVDDDFISIHHWLKWPKFGFTRSWDNLSLEIRNGRISRDEAIDTLKRLGDETPHADIERWCEYVGIPTSRFFEIAEGFRDPGVWKRDADGEWHIPGFLLDTERAA